MSCGSGIVSVCFIIDGESDRLDLVGVGGLELVVPVLSNGDAWESKLNLVLRVDFVESPGQCFCDLGVSH